ncbi:MAG: FAD/NAD(P)-binding protein [Cellvibrionaceae bacterium]
MDLRFKLAIVGGGPSATYTLERLAAYISNFKISSKLEITIFDKTKKFGSGQVHDFEQPNSSFLNRISGQVSFAADESIIGAGPLLPEKDRLTLDLWAQKEFIKNGNKDFDLNPTSWPKRYIHGLALKYYFEKYIKIIRSNKVQVSLVNDEVIDIKESDYGFDVLSRNGSYQASHLLFVTGHSFNSPLKDEMYRKYIQFSSNNNAEYISSAYPLEKNITSVNIKPTTSVACLGMGLTTIDIILFLTEGRGGVFEEGDKGELIYKKTGKEPKNIIAFSQSGLFTFARPYNAKEENLEKYEHKGVFLTKSAIDCLRKSKGILNNAFGSAEVKQLNFRDTLWPLMQLEMAFLYYKTLLGSEFSKYIEAVVRPVYDSFINDSESVISTQQLIDPISNEFLYLASTIDEILLGKTRLKNIDVSNKWDLSKILNHYLTVILGESLGKDVFENLKFSNKAINVKDQYISVYDHNILLIDNQYDWDKYISPIDYENYSSPDEYKKAFISFMEKDHLHAKQNNLKNPGKSMSDGVWRDLREVLSYAADFGGLTPDSHKEFLNVFMRHHNRVANGAALEVMEKIKALIIAGIVDISIGPNAEVLEDESSGKFRIYGEKTGAEKLADVLINSKVHTFDPEIDASPLYPNLLKKGLITKWVNPANNKSDNFKPGGLHLTEKFHPVNHDGEVDTRMTFLGPPSEGVMFFQLGALRPNQNHHVMKDILIWVKEFWSKLS